VRQVVTLVSLVHYLIIKNVLIKKCWTTVSNKITKTRFRAGRMENNSGFIKKKNDNFLKQMK
jgi:hypothetical protein